MPYSDLPPKPCNETGPKATFGTAGFSLLEVLIAIALIALLSTVAITQVDKIFGRGQGNVAHIFVTQSLEIPLLHYSIDVGSYPTTSEGLKALLEPPSGKSDKWNGPYLKKLEKDPWKKEYNYRFPGQKNIAAYDIWSSGPDGIDNTTDDIVNWE